MKPTFLQRIAYWLRSPSLAVGPGCAPSSVPPRAVTLHSPERPAYLADFGANIEEKGAEPMGWEKAP